LTTLSLLAVAVVAPTKVAVVVLEAIAPRLAHLAAERRLNQELLSQLIPITPLQSELEESAHLQTQ
jgi:hypothetical protein